MFHKGLVHTQEDKCGRRKEEKEEEEDTEVEEEIEEEMKRR